MVFQGLFLSFPDIVYQLRYRYLFIFLIFVSLDASVLSVITVIWMWKTWRQKCEKAYLWRKGGRWTKERVISSERKKWNEVWIYITKVEILVEGVRTSKKDLVWYAPGKLLLIRVVESFSSFFWHSKNGRAHTDTENFGKMLVAWYVIICFIGHFGYSVWNCLIFFLVGTDCGFGWTQNVNYLQKKRKAL